MTTLFPNPKYSAVGNPVPAKAYQRLPGAGHWFYLDDTIGQERMVLLAAKTSLADPEALCARVVSGQTGSTAVTMNRAAGNKARGLGGVVHEKPVTEKSEPPPALVAHKDGDTQPDDPEVFVIQRVFLHQ
jgi:hypothetical protein